MSIENRTVEARSTVQSFTMLTYCILAVRIPGPVSGIVFIDGWFRKIAQRFSQNAGDFLEIGKIKPSLAQLVVR